MRALNIAEYSYFISLSYNQNHLDRKGYRNIESWKIQRWYRFLFLFQKDGRVDLYYLQVVL